MKLANISPCAAISLAGMILCLSAQATVYPGNGNTGFGGPIGNGSLTVTDDGTNVFATVTKGTGAFGAVLVVFIDPGSGSGFSGTTNFTDAGDGLRKAISGFDGGNRSTLEFPAAFKANYAIALGPASDNFGGLWLLLENATHLFIRSVNLAPTGNSNAPTYTFSFNVADLGLATNSGAVLKLVGTYISNTGYRSTEAVAGDVTGVQGWNPFTSTNATYVLSTHMGGVASADSADFALDTTGTAPGIGGVVSADSGDFTLDTTGTAAGAGGVAYADSGDFTLNTLIPSAPPVFGSIMLSGANVILAGTNSTAGTTYYVLTSTNVALPVTNWTRLTTNTFDANGNFSFTNAITPSIPRRFYLLQLP